MKKSLFKMGVGLTVFSIILISSLTFASDKGIVKSQGILMALDLKKKTMIINEQPFTWDQDTVIHNEKGSPLTLDHLKARTWVYVEGVREKGQKKAVVKKIYLLPKYIDEREKSLYPFIK